MRKVFTGFGVLALIALLTSASACGVSDVGESCDEEGKVGGECEDGAVCGKDNAGSLVCLKQCATTFECGNGECGAVGGTALKGCRARKL